MKINVTIKPNSTKGPLVEENIDGSLTVYVREIPAENQANTALVKLIAKHFNIPKSNVKILRGYKSKNKIIEIEEQNGQRIKTTRIIHNQRNR